MPRGTQGEKRRGVGRGSTPSTSASASRRVRAAQPQRSFNEYYAALYDAPMGTKARALAECCSLAKPGRWRALVAAMARPSAKVALWNRFCSLPMDVTVRELGLERIAEYPTGALNLFRCCKAAAEAAEKGSSSSSGEQPAGGEVGNSSAKGDDSGVIVADAAIPPPPRDINGTPAYYILDLASALVVTQLEVEPFNKVLDMCAAPGGKSIAICQYLAPAGELTANEPATDRVQRLRRNLLESVPPDVTGMQGLTVSQRDATRWYQPAAFDRVLLDAPCSSERHLVAQGIAGAPSTVAAAPTATATATAGAASASATGHGTAKHGWSDRYSAEMSVRQTELLLRAIETLKVGGRLVYSTCSISPLENDEVIAAAMRKSRCGVKVLPTALPLGGEATTHGWMVLPDVCDGWGPMYCATLTKTSEVRSFSSEDDDDSDE